MNDAEFDLEKKRTKKPLGSMLFEHNSGFYVRRCGVSLNIIRDATKRDPSKVEKEKETRGP